VTAHDAAVPAQAPGDTTMQVDHLVVVAHTLQQGVDWCVATLGVTPAAGGRHDFMGTHNRLLAMSAPGNAVCYFEIIAIDPDAPPPARVRWFGMDEPVLQAAVRSAPQLVHWVARCADVAGRHAAFVDAGFDPGPVLAASRETPAGTLSWRITVPVDGRPLCSGALPTLIEWQGPHPAPTLPASGLGLLSLTLRGVPARAQALLNVQAAVASAAAGPALTARLSTPLGERVLESTARVDAAP
jgi:hypothetical protein